LRHEQAESFFLGRHCYAPLESLAVELTLLNMGTT
jgi:hypothetical protein